MPSPARIATLAFAALALTGCGTASLSTGGECTMIGTPRGIGLAVEPPLAARAADATVEICWNGVCRTVRTELRDSTTAVPRGCADGPDGACAATASPTGGKNGFADVNDLPESPVRVTLTLRDARGGSVLKQQITTTPQAVYANGPHCGKGGPQASLTVANGRVTVARP
ncbi:hypothetical protein ACSNOI_16750 [Actinomadura kijaniata]|uniref:hypothetical protein n=1 Tax=Actinomadura kijaniata TaxID=46161 RepID=UPI003F1E28DB